MENNRFLLQPSQKKNHYVVTDTLHNVVFIFEKNNFNDSNKVIELDNIPPSDFMKIARINREIAEWIVDNHSDLI